MPIRGNNFVRKSWFANKTRFCFIMSALILQIVLLIIGVIDYLNLKIVIGVVDELKMDGYKKERYLSISLKNDRQMYYQEYIKRFLDKDYQKIKKEDSISFYTTSREYHKRMMLLAANDPLNIRYYPIFNINGKKSLLSVLLFHFYRNSLLAILFYISLAGAFFYSIPYAATTNWKNRIVVLCIVAIYVYLFY